MSKIYISGKITGLANYREIFKKAEDKLIADGNIVMNPAVIGEGFAWEEYIPICLAMLKPCDTIYMLSNWKESKGARLELKYAKLQRKSIRFESEEAQ